MTPLRSQHPPNSPDLLVSCSPEVSLSGGRTTDRGSSEDKKAPDPESRRSAAAATGSADTGCRRSFRPRGGATAALDDRRG